MERSNRYRRGLDTGENASPVPDRCYVIVHKVGMSLRMASEINGVSQRSADGRVGMLDLPLRNRVHIEAPFQQQSVIFPPITPSFPPAEHVTTYLAY